MGAKYSYHIEKRFDNHYIAWWPIAGFGHYCGNLETAQKALVNENKNGGEYRIVRYKAVTQYGKIVGVVADTHEIMKE